MSTPAQPRQQQQPGQQAQQQQDKPAQQASTQQQQPGSTQQQAAQPAADDTKARQDAVTSPTDDGEPSIDVLHATAAEGTIEHDQAADADGDGDGTHIPHTRDDDPRIQLRDEDNQKLKDDAKDNLAGDNRHR